MVRTTICLLIQLAATAGALAQPIPKAFHGMWGNGEDCDQATTQSFVSARGMATSNAFCQIESGTLRQRPSGISFQSKCAVVRDGQIRDGFTVLEFEAGQKSTVLIRTHFIKGVTERKDIRPDSLGLCIRDKPNMPYRFTTMDSPPMHWRAYEPQRAARLVTGETAIDLSKTREPCDHPFCRDHNEAERCFVEQGKSMCTVIYTERKGTSMFRGFINTRTGAMEKAHCVANCFGKIKGRRMTIVDIDSDYSDSEAVEEEEG